MATPNQPEYWNARYLNDDTPWDFDGVPADLKEFLQKRGKGAKVLIPGCGSGHEIKAFAEAGYEVTAIDFAPFAVDRARRMVGSALAENILLGDFFQYDFPGSSFDLIYERAFACAFTPDRRQAYRDRLAQLLKYRGLLIGYYYYKRPLLTEGPPFGFAWGTADDLFARYFILTKDEPVNDSLPLFAGRERWQERRRTSIQE
ncbi:MAG TPA: methyltransferase domain-containing protein [Lacunisphaera sp.]|nr:methyltransferase domain-containing protein [Lacunisphaera sp.]